jgi:hypothetical protein
LARKLSRHILRTTAQVAAFVSAPSWGENIMAQAKRSSESNVVRVDPKLNRPPQADESVPEALVPDVVRTTLHPSEPETAPGTQMAAPDRWQRIQQRAYEIALQRGFTPGAELNDWLQAEREIDGTSNDLSARQSAPEDQFTG